MSKEYVVLDNFTNTPFPGIALTTKISKTEKSTVCNDMKKMGSESSELKQLHIFA